MEITKYKTQMDLDEYVVEVQCPMDLTSVEILKAGSF